MDVGNWQHVAALEAASEREEFAKWTEVATIQQAEMRGYGLSCMELVELTQDWFGKVRLLFVKKNIEGAMSGAKNGQIFHLCPSVGAKTRQRSFKDSTKVAKGVVIQCNMEGAVSLALDEDQCERLMDYVEEKEEVSMLLKSRWDLCLEGCEVTTNLRFQLLRDFPHRSPKPQQHEMIQRLGSAIRQPRYEPVDPRLVIPPSDSIGTDAIHLPTNFRQAHPFLNEPQLRAVANTLSKPVSCIHGPPGTGKTTTVAELIIELHNSKKRVLVTGPSNISVDNVLRLCTKNEEVRKACVRLGHPARIHSDLHAYTFDRLAGCSDIAQSCWNIRFEISLCISLRAAGQMKNLKNSDLEARLRKGISKDREMTVREVREATRREIGVLRKELKGRESRTSANVFETRSLVFCTCAGAMKPELTSFVKKSEAYFDYVIIDEAAKATVLDSLMPCLIGKRVVLAGDHKQLRATVKSKEAEDIGLGVSLMERLINERVPSVMLQVQYRMNQQLMSWPSNQFYGGALQAAPSVADEFLDEDTPGLYWCDTADVDFELFKETVGPRQSVRDPSKYNLAEAVIVRAYISNLLAKFDNISSIGVISFYSRQVKLLNQYLRSYKFEKKGKTEISVETVDGFQGKEADVIILSTVRSNKNKEIGFLAEATRINVSVTRARRHCAIVGDSKTVTNNDILGSLFDACQVETCLTQIEHDKIVEEKGELSRKFRHDDFEDADERQKGSNTQGGKKGVGLRSFRGSNHKGGLKTQDLEFRKEITNQLKNLSPESPTINFQGLSAFKRMVVHSIAGEMGLIHITSKDRDDPTLTVRLPGAAESSVGGSLENLNRTDSSTEQSVYDRTRTSSQKNRFQILLDTTSSLENDTSSSDSEMVNMILSGPASHKRTMLPSGRQERRAEANKLNEERMKRNRTGLCALRNCKESIRVLNSTCRTCGFVYCFTHVVKEEHSCI